MLTLLAGLAALAALTAFHACVLSRPPAVDPPDDVSPVVTRAFGDLRVHVVNTGWVRVKQAHRELAGPESLRLAAIVAGLRWTEWMPVLVAVLEHPEGVFLVDSGMTEALLDPEHFACDPGTRYVYTNLLDFRFTPEQRIDRRLAQLGIDPGQIRGVVLTHRHADHTEGLVHVPKAAAIYVGAGDWPSHNGALACRWPEGRAPVLVGREGRALTQDGRLTIVPLVGHSPGHLGVALRTDTMDLLFAGDATFSVEQVAQRKLAGIVEQPAEARASLDAIAARLAGRPTALVLAHDPASLGRFARGEPTTLPAP